MIHRIADFILGRALPPGEMRRNIREDLQQELHDLRDEHPGRSFRLWYLWEAIKLGAYFTLVRFRPGTRRGTGDKQALRPRHDPPLGRILRELRFATRRLLRRPAFTLVAVLTLGLGIGANTAIFTVVNGVLLRPLPYPDDHRLVSLWTTDRRWRESENDRLREVWDKVGASFPVFLEWRDGNRVFEHLGAYHGEDLTLVEGGVPERVQASPTTAGVFAALDVPPLLGRTIQPGDDRMGADRVALLSYGLWQRRFGADPEIVGRTIHFEDEALTVVGVMPRSFYFPGPEIEIWTTFDDEAKARGRRYLFLHVIGRLSPGISLEQAVADMAAVNDGIREDHPGEHDPFGTRVAPYMEEVVGDVGPALLLALGAVGLVLLIACSNVASLLLARGTERQGELAVRAALGAGRGRLAGEIMSEAVGLAVLGGGLGVLVAWLAVGPLVALLPPETPRPGEIYIDPTVLSFSTGLTLLALLLIGALPALRAGHTRIAGALAGSSRGSDGARGHGRIRSALVAGEIALTFILLVSAAVLLKSLDSLYSVDKGFSSEDVLVVEILPPEARYPGGDPVVSFYATLAEELEKVPGVTAVAGSYSPPFTGNSWQAGARIGGSQSAERIDLGADLVFGSFFDVMEIPLLAGRTLEARDSQDRPGAVVVNEALARRFWPEEDPLGQVIEEGGRDFTVVGVVANVKQLGLDDRDRPIFYLSMAQRSRTPRRMYVFVKSGIGVAAVAPAVRETLWEIDSRIPIRSMTTLDELVSRSVAAPRSRAILMSASAWLAMLLAMVGVYGVTSYAVSQRTRELSLRMALGARARSVLGGVLGEAMAMVGLGLAMGSVGAFFVLQLLEPFLFRMAPLDLPMMGVAALALAGTTVLASVVPASRATRADPAQALKGS